MNINSKFVEVTADVLIIFFCEIGGKVDEG